MDLQKLIYWILTFLILTFFWGLVGNYFNSHLLSFIVSIKSELFGYIDAKILAVCLMLIISIIYSNIRG